MKVETFENRQEATVLNDAVGPLRWDKTYCGERTRDGVIAVWVEETNVSAVAHVAICGTSRRALPLHLDVRNHSPSGFEWGYGGSGPAQLALALLIDALGDTHLAQAHYQDFKFQVVAGLSNSWTITAKEIRDFVSARSSSEKETA